MNPKTVKDLDPKLKEAYERIMGSNFTPKSAESQPTNPTNNQPQPEQKPLESSQAPKPAQNTPIMQTTQVFSQNPQPSEPTPELSNQKEEKKETKKESDPTSLFTSSPSTTSATQKKSLNMLPLLFAIGAIVFFGAYVVIWAKVFGLF